VCVLSRVLCFLIHDIALLFGVYVMTHDCFYNNNNNKVTSMLQSQIKEKDYIVTKKQIAELLQQSKDVTISDDILLKSFGPDVRKMINATSSSPSSSVAPRFHLHIGAGRLGMVKI
jgi:hypothetical protein